MATDDSTAPDPTTLRVTEIWRYPVKSMQGQRLDAAGVSELGIHGDRQWALVDLDSGLTLTARRAPELLFAHARLLDADTVEIELPDGTVTADGDRLSAWLGRPVELRRAGAGAGTYEIATDFEDEAGSDWVRWDGPDTTFHDSTRTRVSLLSTTTIGGWDRRRFRANVILDAPSPGAEDDLVGRRVAVGTTVLDVVKPIDRCVMTTRPQPDGIERDLDVLRTINRDRNSLLGVSCLVVRPGDLAVGDAVTAVPVSP